jgi:DNA-binding phage protein
MNPKVQHKGTIVNAQLSFKGARPHLDPLLREMGTLLETEAGFLDEVCKTAGIHRQTLAKWMRGERTPTLLHFNAVLQTLGFKLKIVKDWK